MPALIKDFPVAGIKIVSTYTDKRSGELGDLILGKVMGRTDSKQITLMKTVGFAAFDIVIAYNVYKKAVKAGVGRVF